MEPIRVVWGTGGGPTALSAYDAALAAANVHEYNLLDLSSVIPAEATVEEVGRAPDLGPGGNALYVVQAAATAERGPASAALAWARSPDGPGLFYEESGTEPADAIVDRVSTGLEAGADLRERPYGHPSTRVVEVDADDVNDDYASAAVLAVYGRSEPLL